MVALEHRREIWVFALEQLGINVRRLCITEYGPHPLAGPLGKLQVRTADDEGTGQVWIAHTDLQRGLSAVAVAVDQRPLEIKSLRERHHISREQPKAHAARWICGPAMTTAVRR